MAASGKEVFILPSGFWMQMGGTYPHKNGFSVKSAMVKERIELLAEKGWEVTMGDIRKIPMLPDYDDPRIQNHTTRIFLNPPSDEVKAWLESLDHRLLGTMYARLCLAGLAAEEPARSPAWKKVEPASPDHENAQRRKQEKPEKSVSPPVRKAAGNAVKTASPSFSGLDALIHCGE